VSHFRDEIAEQPEVASRLLVNSREAVARIGARIRETQPRGYLVAARGSSDHAALYAKYLFGARNLAVVALAAPSLFTHYASAPSIEGQCVIGISQSGASPDIVTVIEESKRQGALTIAITNDAQSPLAEAAELVLTLGTGAERSVPASKTYTASLLALALISQAVDPDAAFGAALSSVPAALARALDMDSHVEKLAVLMSGTRAIVLGRGFNFSTAEELALKLMETSYVMSRAWSIADFEHGPIAVVEAGIPVVVIDGGGAVATSMQSIRERLGAKGCPVVQLVDGKMGGKTAEVDPSTTVQLGSGLPEELTPISLAVLAQLLAYRVAVVRGFNPDSPREIHKVTRTW
jgi:glutamine---fructose-6-phosphate transaminase (isomerizing)